MPQRPDDQPGRSPVGSLGSQLRKERHPEARGDHLPECLEAGGSEILRFVHVDLAAALQRLVPKAVSVRQQQKSFAVQIRHLEMGSLRQGMTGRQCGQERFRVQGLDLQAFLVDRQRQYGQVYVALIQGRQQIDGLMLQEE